MKSILVLTVFAVIITFSAGSAVAESNPLLTVFEGIKIGMPYDDFVKALRGFKPVVEEFGQVRVNGEIFDYRWRWKDRSFHVDPTASAHVDQPVALLMVEIKFVEVGYGEDKRMEPQVVGALYIYKFLHSRKEVKK